MRLTIDLDSWWFTDLQRVINKAIELGLGFPDIIRRSPSKKGYHLIWYGLKLSKNEIIKLRLMLGDDVNRIYFDIVCDGKPEQVLFYKKKIVRR